MMMSSGVRTPNGTPPEFGSGANSPSSAAVESHGSITNSLAPPAGKLGVGAHNLPLRFFVATRHKVVIAAIILSTAIEAY